VASLTSDLYQDAQTSVLREVMNQATKHANDNNYKRCEVLKQGVIIGMMKSENRWETDREKGIEAALKIARDELIRR
jgi:hypothetical protein